MVRDFCLNVNNLECKINISTNNGQLFHVSLTTRQSKRLKLEIIVCLGKKSVDNG